jgi:hypothetical protein
MMQTVLFTKRLIKQVATSALGVEIPETRPATSSILRRTSGKDANRWQSASDFSPQINRHSELLSRP